MEIAARGGTLSTQTFPVGLALTDDRHRPTGMATVALVAALVAVAVTGAWLLRSVFFVAAALLVLLVGYAAARWPRATLVAAVLATLGDPYVIRGLIPAELHFLVSGFSETLIVVVGLVVATKAVRAGTLVSAFRDPVTLVAIAFVAVAVASALVNGVPPLVAVLGIIVTVDAIGVYYLARMLPFEQRSMAWAIAALVGAATLAALIAIGQAFLTPQILWFQAFQGNFGEGGRVTAFLGNPNMLAALIGLAIPFPLYATRHLPTRRQRWAAIGVLFLLSLALLLTFSRGAWVAVLLGILIGAVIVDWRVLRVMVVVLVVAYLVAAFTPRNLLVEPDQIPQYAENPTGESPPDFFDSIGNRIGAVASNKDLRVRYIVEAVPILLDHPILGVGPGRYGGAVARITDSPVYAEYDTSLYGFRTVHNFWLHTLGEVGALGTAVFVVLVLGLIARLAVAARRATGLELLIVGGAATTAIVVSLNSITEMLFEGNFPALAFWLVAGLASLLAPPLGRLRATDRQPQVSAAPTP